MQPHNLLVILSDQHARSALSCYGHPLVQTPHIDALARRGTRFLKAWCNSPLCIPSRASLATGDFVHKIGCWDAAQAYEGRMQSWAHRVARAGSDAVAIGKLHFRERDSNGFTREIDTLHIYEGKGDLLGLLRNPLPQRGANDSLARHLGAGRTTYTDYDRRIAEAARSWLRDAARRQDANRPWMLMTGFVSPHFPLVAPDEFFGLYAADRMPMPYRYRDPNLAEHPVINELKRCMNQDDYFTDDTVRLAIASYFGLVSFVDDLVGSLIATLEETGLADTTRVLYTSDHGEMLGSRSIWGKSVMYEESVAVPLILSGPDVPSNHVVDTPVSLVDIYPTVLDSLGIECTAGERELPGHSLYDIAASPSQDRTVLSEYHAEGASTGIFALRNARYKYIHYVGHGEQLFDLEHDPEETRDLVLTGQHEQLRLQFRSALYAMVNPELVNAMAFDSQRRLIDKNGGRQAILTRGDFDYTPAPGQVATFR
jgi:choline-sulfatase